MPWAIWRIPQTTAAIPDAKSETPTSGDKGTTTALTPTVAAAITLAVAALGSIGLSGDFLVSAVRNSPWLMAISISLVVIAAAVATAWSTWSTQRFRGGLVATTILLAIGLLIGIATGAQSIRDRTQPSLGLSAKDVDATTTSITVEVSGAGLSNLDSLLVQVVGIKPSEPFANDIRSCEGSQIGRPVDPGRSELLAWQRSGSDSKGGVSRKIELPVPRGTYATICAWAALPERNSNAVGDDRQVPAYLRLPTPSG